MTPRGVFWRRLWAFLNYSTTLGLTWRHLLSLALAGLLIAWSLIRDWAGIDLLGPVALYLLLLGFSDLVRMLLGQVRRVYYWLSKPLDVQPEPQKRFYGAGLILALAGFGLLLWVWDPRVAMLFGVVVLTALIEVWVVHDQETASGKRSLSSVAGRLPIVAILPNGELVQQDGSRSRIALLTSARSGYKPALAAADVANILTKFLAFIAQYELEKGGGDGLPLKFFWLTDYHLGQLDLGPSNGTSPTYLAELRSLVESGAQRARVVLSGLIYPPEVEHRLAEWLGPLDLGVSPLGAFAAESFVRHLLLGESFLGQIQKAHLNGSNGLRGLPSSAQRGFLPETLSFHDHLYTGSNWQDVLRIDTPFSEAKDSLVRAMQSVDGFLCVELRPLPRAETASEYRGRLLAARVPGLGRLGEARLIRQVLDKLEDRRSLDYIFQARTHLTLCGSTETELNSNRALAESFLLALNFAPLADRALEDSLSHWLPVISTPSLADGPARLLNWLAAPPPSPATRLLTEQMVMALRREEGSDVHLADARNRILLGRSVSMGKEGLRYADFRSDTGPVLLVSDQGGGKSSTLIVWFILRLQILHYKILAINLKYSTRMQLAIAQAGGVTLHPQDDITDFEGKVRAALFSNQPVLYQPVKGTRPYAIADDPCLLSFVRIMYEEWLPSRETPAALVIDEIHRLLPKDQPLSENASQIATLIAEAFKDWAERKLVIAAATQTLRDLYGSNLGLALQKFRTDLYFQVGPEDREALVEKGYAPELIDLIVGDRRRPRGYAVLVMPDGFYTTIKILVTPEEKAIIQRLDVEETADVTPQLTFR